MTSEKSAGLQGQRPLNRCAGKHFQQEVFAPSATAPLHDDAGAAGMLLEEREREAVEPGEVLPDGTCPRNRTARFRPEGTGLATARAVTKRVNQAGLSAAVSAGGGR